MNTSSVALSGMAAAQQRLQAHAHNLANGGTEGFRRSMVAQTEAATGGTTATWQRAAAAGPDLAADMVGQLSASHAFMANLAVFKAGDTMAGALLDAVA